MDPEIVARSIRFQVGHAIGALGRSNARVAAAERGKFKVGCAIAENRVGAEAGALKGPCAPHVISVDSDAIRDGILVIHLPEGVSKRFQHGPLRCLPRRSAVKAGRSS